MDQTARRRRRNLIQNIAIALLSVSAVLLFAQRSCTIWARRRTRSIWSG